MIKADVQGSLEAIIGSLDKLGTDEGRGARAARRRRRHLRVRRDAGRRPPACRSSPSTCAPTRKRARRPKRAGIEIRYYNIIYDLVDDVKKAMSGLLAPTLRETMLGNAQILEIFKVSKVGNIAGCRVTDGTVERGANVRLIRDNVVIHEGKLASSSASRTTPRKSRRHGMRHGLRELPGHAARRRHRMLPGGDDFNAACESKSQARAEISILFHRHARL